MDDKSWDDYIRETPGTIHGDEARRARERMQGNSGNINVGGIRAGGYDSTAPEREAPVWLAKIFLALLYAFGIFHTGYVQLDLQWSWNVFFGMWAGLSIVQFIWPSVFRIMGYLFGLAILGGLVYFIYLVAIA